MLPLIKNNKNKSSVFKSYATIVLATLTILIFLNSHGLKVFASNPQTLYGIGTTSYYPSSIQNYFSWYDNYPQSTCSTTTNPAEAGWISVNQSTSTLNSFQNDTLTVNSGSVQTVPLKLSFSDLVCHDSTSNNAYYRLTNPKDGPIATAVATQTEINVVGVSSSVPGTFSGMPITSSLILPSNSGTKYWFIYDPFSFTPKNPITSNFTITISFVAINYFHDTSINNAYCVNGGQKVSGSFPYYNCPTNQWSVNIKVTVNKKPPPPPTSNSCPGFPNFSSIFVPMPYTGPSYSSAQSTYTYQSATSPYPGLYYQYTPQGVKETSLQDASIGGSQVLPTKISESDGSPQTSASASGSVTLNYLPYVQAYPYDYNQPQVNYNNIYQQTVWTPQYVTTYCPSGGSLSGTNCTYSATLNPGYYTCPWPYYYYNGGCFNASGNTTTPIWNPPYYSCPYGGYLNGTTCIYTATTIYSWSAGSTQTINQPTSTLGQQMIPCYGRIFTLLPINGASASLQLNGAVNYEYPNTANLLLPLQYYFDIPPGDPFPGDGFRQDTQLSGVNANGPADKYHQFASGNNSYLGNICNPNQTLSTFIGPGIGNSNLQNASLSCSITTDDDNDADFVAGDYAVFNGNVNYQQGNLTETSAYGTFSVSNSASIPYGPYQTQNVYTKPYINVNGGDVLAGFGQTNNACSASNVYTWNQNSGQYYGSGSTLAVITGGLVDGFASGQNTSNVAPNGLIFSNNVFGSNYGGQFCSNPTPPTVSSSQTQQLYNQLSSVYGGGNGCNLNGVIDSPCIVNYGNGSYTMPSNLNIGPGGHVIFFGTGNFNVNSDFSITMPGGMSDNPSYIPSLEVVVGNGGNINIANNVTQIAGSYMTTGNINDCVIGGSLPSPSNNMFNDIRQPSGSTCGNQLVVNGVLEANQIKFDRTYDSLYESTPPLSDSSGSHGGTWVYTPPTCRWYNIWIGYRYIYWYFCYGGGYTYVPYNINDTGKSSYNQTTSDAAEIFNYSPLSWLTPNDFQGLYQNQSTPVVQSVTSLAPIITP